MRLFFYTAFFIFTFHIFFAQQSIKIDSVLTQKIEYSEIIIGLQQKFSAAVLENALKNESNESHQVKILNALCWKYFNSNPQKALESAKLQIRLAEKLKLKDAIGEGYTNLGFLYNNLGQYEKSISHHLKALSIKEEKKDSAGIVTCLNGIGSVCFTMGDFTKALQYMTKALQLDSILGDKINLATNYENVGVCYMNLNQYDKALNYLLKSEALYKELKQKQSSSNLLNTGIIYQKKGKLEKAFRYLQNALMLAEQEKDVSTIASVKIALGNFFTQKEDYINAIKCIKQALGLARENKLIDIEIQALKTLADINFDTGKYQQAFKYHKQFSELKDTLLTEKNSRAITEMNTKYETDKKEKQIEIQNLTLTHQNLELNKRQIIIYSTVGGIVLLSLLSFFILRGYRQKRHVNIELANKNSIILEKNKIVEEKHKEITDSINYAERIQRSFLATKEVLDQNLNDYFVFFRPKDVVSGDFYWANKLSNGWFALATADSTGHGVPGAIMSILNISSLEKAIEQNLYEPAEILNHTRKTIIERLKKDGSIDGGKDGMDASLICFDFIDKRLKYAAANNPVWVVREHALIDLIPDKMPVGKHDKELTSFTQQEFKLCTGDIVYSFTDGMPDQFGGPKKKKFMYKQLKTLLITLSSESMEVQKQKINDVFDNWKADLEQVDDVTLIGIRI